MLCRDRLRHSTTDYDRLTPHVCFLHYCLCETRQAFAGYGCYGSLRLAQDIKESICFCAYAPLATLEKPKEYRHRLPDGQEIEVTAFSRLIPEVLLTGTAFRGECFLGVPQLVSEAILTLPGGASSAGSEVVLVGGSSRFVNFKDRLQTALAEYLDGRRVKVSTVDHRYASCLGASVAAQLQHPLIRRITKADYQENGSEVFSRLL